MLRIYACVVAAVLGVIAIAAAVRISSAGLGVSVLYYTRVRERGLPRTWGVAGSPRFAPAVCRLS
jgi:hypothetical protein